MNKKVKVLCNFIFNFELFKKNEIKEINIENQKIKYLYERYIKLNFIEDLIDKELNIIINKEENLKINNKEKEIKKVKK